MLKKSMTVGIAGAGVMGRVLAWQLLQAGYTVSIFDKDDIDFGSAAAYTSAGMLTPYCEFAVSHTQLRAHETPDHLVCPLLLARK